MPRDARPTSPPQRCHLCEVWWWVKTGPRRNPWPKEENFFVRARASGAFCRKNDQPAALGYISAFVAGAEGCGVRVMPSAGLPSLIIGIAITVTITALIGAPAPAQNLDQDMSGAKLFAASCADCHRSARGLAKG